MPIRSLPADLPSLLDHILALTLPALQLSTIPKILFTYREKARASDVAPDMPHGEGA